MQSRWTARTRLRRLSHLLGAAASTVLFTGLAACTSTAPPPTPTYQVPERHAAFLVAPLDGYPMAVDSERAAALNAAWRELRSGAASIDATEAAALGMLETDPGLHPAIVLAAQARMLRDEASAVVEMLRPVLEEVPGYTAAALLFGHAAEEIDAPELAFLAYREAAEQSALAAELAETLRLRVVDDLYQRLDDALDRRRPRDAAESLAQIRELEDGESRRTLDAERRIAFARGDRQAELTILRRLAEDAPRDEELARLGELELEGGEVRRGLEVFEDLAARRPDEALYAEQLDRAKLLWRLQSLPSQIQSLAEKARLDRSELAALLYWLVPEVRYAQVSNPPIATDILDHPFREEMLRVMNLGLMRVNETLHTFSPEAPVTRSQALDALLHLLRMGPVEPSCLSSADLSGLGRGSGQICRKAAQCRLIPEVADCLPDATLSGTESIELFRRSLDLSAPR